MLVVDLMFCAHSYFLTTKSFQNREIIAFDASKQLVVFRFNVIETPKLPHARHQCSSKAIPSKSSIPIICPLFNFYSAQRRKPSASKHSSFHSLLDHPLLPFHASG